MPTSRSDAMVDRYPDWVSRQQRLILGLTG
jgi:hypothetical protein